MQSAFRSSRTKHKQNHQVEANKQQLELQTTEIGFKCDQVNKKKYKRHDTHISPVLLELVLCLT